MSMEIKNDYYESLLDDPQDPQEQQIEDIVEEVEDAPLLPEQPSDNSEEIQNEEEKSTGWFDPNDDVLTSYLKFNGIDDPTKIQFENEDGGIDEVDFNSLSREEQLTMLH